MAKINFKSLSPEEVMALNEENKAKYDAWLAKQNKDENDSKEVVLVKVKALKNINTSLHGNIKEGKEGELPSDLAEQLYLNGDCELINDSK